MEDWQEWDYLEDEILVRKRRKICITCNHFRYSTTSSCVTIIPVPFIKSLFLKEIISLKDVDIGEKTTGYLLQSSLKTCCSPLVKASRPVIVMILYAWYE